MNLLLEVIAQLENLELVWGDDLFDLGLLNDDPWALATSVGVSILSDKSFVAGHIDPNFKNEGGVIVSALFDSYYDDEYAFDTVVHREYQGKGLGSELIKIAMSKFNNDILDMNPDAKLVLDVVNKDIIPFLERKYNLVVESIDGGHYIMVQK